MKVSRRELGGRVLRWSVLSLLVLGAAWTVWNWRATISLEAVGEELERRGLTPPLGRLPDALPGLGAAPTPEENAAPLLEAAIALMRSVTWPDTEPSDESVPSELRRALPRFGDALALAYRAVERPRCRFDLTWLDGFELRLAHLLGLRDLATLLRARAITRADDGDTAGALEDVRVLFAVSRALEEEPLLISQLVRMALLSLGLETARNVLPRCPRPLEAVATLHIPDARGAFAFGMSGETVVLWNLGIDAVRTSHLEDPRGSGLLDSFLARPYLKSTLAGILRSYAKLLDAAAEPLAEAMRTIEALADEKDAGTGGLDSPIIYSVDEAFRQEAELAVGRAFLDLGALCLDHRAREGSLPAALDDLEEPPTLPFRDGRYRFAKEGDSLLLLREGEDLVRWDLVGQAR